MSRLARNPVAVPNGVTVEVSGQTVKAKGPKGELSFRVHDDVSVTLEDLEDGAKGVRVKPKKGRAQTIAMWGTMWSRILNMVTGVNDGFSKQLEIQGIGYRANVQGKTLNLALGYSHDINYPIPEGIDVAVDQQTAITVSGIDKQQVGQVAAEIRAFRGPEPYKGKGVRYKDEYILRKEGKKK